MVKPLKKSLTRCYRSRPTTELPKQPNNLCFDGESKPERIMKRTATSCAPNGQMLILSPARALRLIGPGSGADIPIVQETNIFSADKGKHLFEVDVFTRNSFLLP